MTYPNNTATILKAAGYASDGDDSGDFAASKYKGVITVAWNATNVPTPPTEQQINDWATDAVALPSGQLFSEWQAEHGGDNSLTTRRRVKEALSSDLGKLVKALALVVLDEFNRHRTNDGDANVTANQLMNSVLSKIEAGDVD